MEPPYNTMCHKLWHNAIRLCTNTLGSSYLEGILPKGPYLPCVSMAGRALLAGYPRPHPVCLYWAFSEKRSCHKEARLYSHYRHTHTELARRSDLVLYLSLSCFITCLWWIVLKWSYLPNPIILGELVKIITSKRLQAFAAQYFACPSHAHVCWYNRVRSASYVVNTMVVDDQAMQGAKTSAVLVLT